MTPKQRAQQLLKAHRIEIARNIVKHIDQVAPSYAQIDAEARVGSVASVLDSFSAVMAGASRENILGLVRDIMQLRAAGGVTRADMLAAVHVYLPCVRWLFVDEADDPIQGLWAYEEVEAVALPLLCRFGGIVLALDEMQEGAASRDLPDAFESLFPIDEISEEITERQQRPRLRVTVR